VQRVEVTVTDRTKTILGIEATVVHDVVSEDGEVIENTFDWYVGSYEDVLMTKDYAPLESDVFEHKFYAQGIGPVLVVQVSGGSSTEKLLSFEPGG
jgi:hypothetical protein